MDAGEDLHIVDLRSILEKDLSSVPSVMTASSQQIPRDREVILFCS